ncbi:MAG: hypothetical protein M0Q13_15455 [Methanothrix sp.]|jgi:hypothetical protein|nr:hypothetical protein [Methanothrix sp.]
MIDAPELFGNHFIDLGAQRGKAFLRSVFGVSICHNGFLARSGHIGIDPGI